MLPFNSLRILGLGRLSVLGYILKQNKGPKTRFLSTLLIFKVRETKKDRNPELVLVSRHRGS